MNPVSKNPYIGPRTFLKEEGHLFFGREREARDLSALVASEKLLLFYAQSGAGKSSLINTRLIPDLENNRYEVLPVGRVSGDFPEGVEVGNIYTYNLMRSLIQHEIMPASIAGLSLSHFLARLNDDEQGYFYDDSLVIDLPKGEEITPWRRTLIVDQFEELLSTHPEAWEKREDFFIQLAEAMEHDPYLWVVLVMREDYIAALDPYAHLLPGGLRVRYYMQRLGWESALKAVKSPVENLRPYAAGVAEKLVENLASIKVRKPDGSLDIQPGQYVEPVQLQVVCYGLWENLASARAQITEDDLREVGDVNQSLEKFYDGRVNAVARQKKVEERLIREWFDNELITGGIRNMVLQGQNHMTGGLHDDVIQALQGDLVRAEMRAGQIWYELSHDRLIEPVQASNAKWYAANLSVFQQQAALWVAQGRSDGLLLRGSDLEQAKAEAKSKAITREERDFLSACEKAHERERREKIRNRLVQILAVLSFILFIFAAVVAVYASNKTNEANAALDEARSSAATATVALGEAEDANAQADSARGFLEADRLALKAQSALGQSVSLGQLLAVEAYRVNSDAGGEILPGVYQALFDSAEMGYDKTLESGTFTHASFGSSQQWLILDNTLWDLKDVQSFRLVDTEKILQSAFRSDDQAVIVAGEMGYYSDGASVYIKDKTNRLQSQFTLTVPEYTYITEIKLSGDGRWVAATYDLYYSYASTSVTSGGVQIWDTQSPSPSPRRLSIQSDRAEHVAISQDGAKLAAIDSSNVLYIWLNRNDLIHAAPLGARFAGGTMIGKAGDGLKFSPDGRWLAVATEGGIQLFDMNNLGYIVIPFDEKDDISGVLFSPSSDSLVYVTSNYQNCDVYYEDEECDPAASAYRWMLTSANDKHGEAFFTDRNSNVTAMDIGAGGRLAIGNSAGIIRAWDLSQPLNDPLVSIAHAGKVASILVGADNDTIISSGERDGTRLWKLSETAATAIIVHRMPHTISRVIRSADGIALYAGGIGARTNNSYAAVHVFSNLEEPTSISDLSLSSEAGNFQALAISDQWIAAGRAVTQRYSDEVASFLDLWPRGSGDATSQPMTVSIPVEVKALAFSQDEAQLAIAAIDRGVWIDSLIDLETRSRNLTSTPTPDDLPSLDQAPDFGTKLPSGLADIQSLVFAGDDRYLIGSSAEGVHVWVMETQAEYEIRNAIHPARISPDQKWMVTASSENAINQYSIEGILSSDPTVVHIEAGLSQFAFSPDGAMLAVAIKSGKVQIYKMPLSEQSEPIFSLQGPASVTSLEFSSAQSTEKWLAAGAGNYAYLWNIGQANSSAGAQNDTPVILKGHQGNLVYTGFTNDGKWVITAAADQTVRFWSLDPGNLRQAACAYAGRNLTSLEWKLFFEGERQATCPEYPLEGETANLEATPTPLPGPIISLYYTVTPTSTPAEIFTTYTVRDGDTLGLIALRFGISVETLMADNGLTNPNLIRVGQVLRIRTANTSP